MDENLFTNVETYINNLMIHEDETLRSVITSLEQEGIPQISIAPNQGMLLHILALTVNARRILEIGTLGGYSTIWMARALPETGKLVTLEMNPHHAEVAQKNIKKAGVSEKVNIMIGKAQDSLNQLPDNETFDMVFIDADKPSYPEYLTRSLRLSHPGTIIVADNVVREGEILDADSQDEAVQGIRQFNSMLGNNPELAATIIPTVGSKSFDGIAIAVVR